MLFRKDGQEEKHWIIIIKARNMQQKVAFFRVGSESIIW